MTAARLSLVVAALVVGVLSLVLGVAESLVHVDDLYYSPLMLVAFVSFVVALGACWFREARS